MATIRTLICTTPKAQSHVAGNCGFLKVFVAKDLLEFGVKEIFRSVVWTCSVNYSQWPSHPLYVNYILLLSTKRPK